MSMRKLLRHSSHPWSARSTRSPASQVINSPQYERCAVRRTHHPISAFACVFALMAAWEVIAPRRRQTVGRLWRWPNNLGVVVIDTVAVRLLFPTAAVGVALIAEA